MKINLIIIFFLSSFTIFSQIVIEDSDFVDVGDVLYQSIDENPSSSISIGNVGLNQIWDFSSLQQNSTRQLSFISPVGTPYEGQYPDANLCMVESGFYSYYNKSASGVYAHGVGDTVFNSPALFYPLPMTDNLNISDGPIVVIDTFITGPFLSLAIPPALVFSLSQGLANRADTALIRITNTTDFIVDASGEVIMPVGSYDALRLKSIKYISSELDVYCSDSITGLGAWVTNVPFTSIPFLNGFSNNETEYKYEWITNDASVDFLLAEIVVDSLDNIQNNVVFLNQNVNEVEESDIDIDIYALPHSRILNIEINELSSSRVRMYNISGALILDRSFTGKTHIDMSSYTIGNYLLNVDSKNGVLSKKVTIY
jgi:hypothetical protein